MPIAVEETKPCTGDHAATGVKALKNVSNDESQSAVLYAKIDQTPPKAVRGRGCYIVAGDGREILDGSSGAAVACIGHNNARVKEAIIRQLDEIAFSYALYFTNDPAERLSRELSESTGGRMSRAFIVSSGTEAVEAAMKMARQYFLELPIPQPQRTRFIGRHQSYHGNTLGSLAMGSHVGRKATYVPIMATNISHVSPCYPYRGQWDGESDESYVSRLAQELEDEFQALGPEKVCAFVAETTLSCVPPTPGYFKAMRAICDRHGALLILDEVMSGMGRTGTLHAWEQEGIVPDLQTIAKGLGAGFYPIGALLVNDRIVKTLQQGTGGFQHSQTYQGHPVACAAAFEVQQIIKEDKLLANVRSTGDYLGVQLRARLSNHRHVGDIRGRGLFWGIEFVEDKKSKRPFPAERKIAWAVHQAALMKYNIVCIAGMGLADGLNGDHIQFAPPYTITSDEIDLLVDRAARAIEHVLG